MSVENWDYENGEAGINRASGVIASIADSWSRCREFGLRAAGTPSEIVPVSYTHLTLPTKA